ncbi:hypothetical protein V5799_009186 [Amblyomma americanum]|uniref:Ig-like domain-containing protein n=1 Tax=Amblyomma americanum TaxID=6943 RepID=A0AAQ4FB74_AMBAM
MAGSGLRLLRLDVPSVARYGQPAWLNCSYDLERDQLYSIKWYKNNVEIYRYLPSETPPTKVYNMPGIHIDVARSNISDLYLTDVDLHSEGKYRCEVSAESPSFQTERAQKEMVVYARHPHWPGCSLRALLTAPRPVSLAAVLPPEDPVIRGLRSQYQLGDLVNLTCSYGPSKPNASLTWYINDRKVPTGSGERVEEGSHHGAEGGEEEESLLWQAHSRLWFSAQASHLWHGAMEVRCASHAALPYFVSSEEITVRDYGRTVDVSGPRMNGPQLEGVRKRYALGGVVDLSCHADPTAPTHGLRWLINDKEAPDSSVSPSPGSSLRLHFRLSEQHFSKGELRLKCVSRQLREFTAASELRVPVGGADRRHSSGLQVSLSTTNGGGLLQGFLWALVMLQVLPRLLAAST